MDVKLEVIFKEISSMQAAMIEPVVPHTWLNHEDQYFPVFSASNFSNDGSKTCKFSYEKSSNTVWPINPYSGRTIRRDGQGDVPTKLRK